MQNLELKYESQNSQQYCSEKDSFTLERYEQFYKFIPNEFKTILDVGCNTGRGGKHIYEKDKKLNLFGLDCVQQRLDKLPECYSKKICSLSTNIDIEDCSIDAIIGGEFIEHLYPSDVDKTLCEFQRILKIGGKLLLTTPNPNYLKSRIKKESIYGISHLSQHFPKLLRSRLMMHGFSNIRIYGSGKASRYLGFNFPIKFLYGSYLITGIKF